jgi:phosphonate C-P lyase system protein PhnG
MNNIPDSQDIPALIDVMDAAAVERILTLAAGEEMEIVRPPRGGLVMMRCTDAFGCDFHLGEVLVCEAELSCCGRRGYGMVSGDRPRWALARAAAELILGGNDPHLQQALRQIAETEQERLTRTRDEERTLTARTRVSFDLMAGK